MRFVSVSRPWAPAKPQRARRRQRHSLLVPGRAGKERDDSGMDWKPGLRGAGRLVNGLMDQERRRPAFDFLGALP